MSEPDYDEDPVEVAKDLALVEHVSWARKSFAERICAASRSAEADVLATLRLEAMYEFANFYFLLRALKIETDEQLSRLAEMHNAYIVELTKDKAKMERMGLREDRLLQAIFTADTLPRLQQTWREAPGTIDQSNLARLLVATMSSETTRKLVLACEAAGFLDRRTTVYGTKVVASTGRMEGIFGGLFRELRGRIAKLGDEDAQ